MVKITICSRESDCDNLRIAIYMPNHQRPHQGWFGIVPSLLGLDTQGILAAYATNIIVMWQNCEASGSAVHLYKNNDSFSTCAHLYKL